MGCFGTMTYDWDIDTPEDITMIPNTIEIEVSL
jgi:hypothetical protein